MQPHRRSFVLKAAMAAAAALAGCQAARGQPSYTVPLEQLQDAVAQKFPRSVQVASLLELTVQAPRLRLLPAVNRLQAAMAVEASGPALRRSHTGAFDVEFALRYEPSDRSLRAHQLRLGRLDFPGLKPAAAELLNTYGPLLAEQSLREITLHRLRPQDTAVLDGLGLQPGAITVTDQGLVVAFERKPS